MPTSRLSAFGCCGSAAWIEQSDVDHTKYRIRRACCNDRFCTPCALAKSIRISTAVKNLVDDRGMSFITLTLCGKGETLTDLLDRLQKHFRALRLHPLWDEAVEGGAAFIEVKWSDKAQRWHPHLHIIAKAKFIDQGELSNVWRGISKDSFIVDIKRIRDPEQVAGYVTKYAGKPLNTSFSNTPRLLDEAITALHGRRLLTLFGTWYGDGLIDSETEFMDEDRLEEGSWSYWSDLGYTLQQASHGNPDAIALLKAVNAEAKWRESLLIE